MCLPAPHGKTYHSVAEPPGGSGQKFSRKCIDGADASAHSGCRSLPKLCFVAVTGMSVLDQDSVNYACILRRMVAPMLKIPGELL